MVIQLCLKVGPYSSNMCQQCVNTMSYQTCTQLHSTSVWPLPASWEVWSRHCSSPGAWSLWNFGTWCHSWIYNPTILQSAPLVGHVLHLMTAGSMQDPSFMSCSCQIRNGEIDHSVCVRIIKDGALWGQESYAGSQVDCNIRMSETPNF